MIHLASGNGKANAITGRNWTPLSSSRMKAKKYTIFVNEMEEIVWLTGAALLEAVCEFGKGSVLDRECKWGLNPRLYPSCPHRKALPVWFGRSLPVSPFEPVCSEEVCLASGALKHPVNKVPCDFCQAQGLPLWRTVPTCCQGRKSLRHMYSNGPGAGARWPQSLWGPLTPQQSEEHNVDSLLAAASRSPMGWPL